MASKKHTHPEGPPSLVGGYALETAFGCPRDFLDNRFVYLVVSPRARGLSVGINVNPDKQCNFDCVYCEVQRDRPSRERQLDVEVMAEELKRTLEFVQAGQVRERPWYRGLPAEVLKLQHVTLSGDGEPTQSEKFAQAVEAVVHLRALCGWPFFKMVLITNATGLDKPGVRRGLKALLKQDEVWVKLDVGTQSYMERINRSQVPLQAVLANILALGRERPVIVQSLFASLNGAEPPAEEIEEYTRRLAELKRGGAQISLVQIYSPTRPTPNSQCGHLPLKSLSRIAQAARAASGLRVEVF